MVRSKLEVKVISLQRTPAFPASLLKRLSEVFKVLSAMEYAFRSLIRSVDFPGRPAAIILPPPSKTQGLKNSWEHRPVSAFAFLAASEVTCQPRDLSAVCVLSPYPARRLPLADPPPPRLPLVP